MEHNINSFTLKLICRWLIRLNYVRNSTLMRQFYYNISIPSLVTCSNSNKKGAKLYNDIFPYVIKPLQGFSWLLLINCGKYKEFIILILALGLSPSKTKVPILAPAMLTLVDVRVLVNILVSNFCTAFLNVPPRKKLQVQYGGML